MEAVNLYIFYYTSFRTVFNLLNFTIRRNNKPFNVSLNDKHVRILMLRGYMDAREECLKDFRHRRSRMHQRTTPAYRDDVKRTHDDVDEDEDLDAFTDNDEDCSD